MPDPIEKEKKGMTEPEGAPPPVQSPLVQIPLVEIPVEAEDVARVKRRKVMLWVAGSLIAVAACAYLYKRSNDPLEAQKSLDAAQRLFTLARYDEAAAACERAIGLRPDFAEAYMLRGKANVAAYRAEQGISDFSKAIQLRPADTRPLLDRSQAYIEIKDYPSAVKDADAAIGLDPELARAYNLRGTALRSLGDTQKALVEFSRAVQLQGNAENYIQLAATYQLLDLHPNAIIDLDEAIRLDPDNPQLYFARAGSERALGQTVPAARDFRYGRYLETR